MEKYELGSPEWWVRRLEQRLRNEQPRINEYRAWYEGRQPLAHVGQRCHDAYRWLLERSRRNWASLTVDAAADRLFVEGFGFGDSTRPWELWQASGMDDDSTLGMLEALIVGRCPVSVRRDASGAARISVDDPAECIVEYAPGSRHERVAALKLWAEAGEQVMHLMLPGRVVEWRRPVPAEDDPAFTPRHGLWSASLAGWGDPVDLPALPMVPVVELRANSRIGRPPRSELEGRIDALKAIDKLTADMLVAAEYGAYRQRWVTGLELAEDESGNVQAPFRHAIDALFVSEDADTRFGEFGATDLGNYVRAIEAQIQHLAAITKTPPHYLLSGMTNLSADAIRAAEAGLVTRVRRHQRAFGEAWEDVMRVALTIEGDAAADDVMAETAWRSPETRTAAELADALAKLRSIEIPVEALWEEWGATPQQRIEWRSMRTREALQAAPVVASPPPLG